MDDTFKFLGLGRGTNPFYICYAQVKGARYTCMSAHNGIRFLVYWEVLSGEIYTVSDKIYKVSGEIYTINGCQCL